MSALVHVITGPGEALLCLPTPTRAPDSTAAPGHATPDPGETGKASHANSGYEKQGHSGRRHPVPWRAYTHRATPTRPPESTAALGHPKAGSGEPSNANSSREENGHAGSQQPVLRRGLPRQPVSRRDLPSKHRPRLNQPRRFTPSRAPESPPTPGQANPGPIETVAPTQVPENSAAPSHAKPAPGEPGRANMGTGEPDQGGPRQPRLRRARPLRATPTRFPENLAHANPGPGELGLIGTPESTGAPGHKENSPRRTRVRYSFSVPVHVIPGTGKTGYAN